MKLGPLSNMDPMQAPIDCLFNISPLPEASPWLRNGTTPAESFRMFLIKDQNFFGLGFLPVLLSSSEY